MILKIENYISLQTAIANLCRFLQEKEVSEEGVFHSRLVASELLGNVLKHSTGHATLHTAVKNGFVELTVCSSVQYTPPKKSVCSDEYAENGRGLFLVDAVSVERTMTESGDILVKIKM